MAIAPMVSATTMAEMRKKIVSSLPSTRRSFFRSAAASRTVMTTGPGSVPGRAAASAGHDQKRDHGALGTL